MVVSNGLLAVSSSRTEDIAAALAGGPYATNGVVPAIYARFTARFIEPPSGPGTYFAHLTGESATVEYRARVFSSATNATDGRIAAPGNFFLSIGNSSGNVAAGVTFPTQLSTNLTYLVILRYEIATGFSTLWIDPIAETSLSVTATNGPSLVNPRFFGFRQATGEGTMWIDSLRVGTSFADVELPLTIIRQPTSQSTNSGATVIFRAVVDGPSTTVFEWQKDGVALVDAANVSGSSTPELTLRDVQLGDSGTYSVVVTSHASRLTSDGAILQVLPTNAPSIRIEGFLAYGTIQATGSVQLSIAGGFSAGLNFYTLDGNTPTTASTLYAGPVTLTNDAIIQALSVSSDFTKSALAPPVVLRFVPTYNLQTSVAGSGTVTANPTNGPYMSNSVVQLTAVPALGWSFSHWNGDLSGNANPASLVMAGPRSVTAVFVRSAYPLTAGTAGGGAVTVNGILNPTNTYYPVGSVVSVEATASNGWNFLRWEGTASGTNNPLALTMNQSNEVRAVFGTEVQRNISGYGDIQMSTNNPVPFGTWLTLTAVPQPGCWFVTWSGVATGTNNPTACLVTNATPTVGALFAGTPAVVILSEPTNVAVLPGQPAFFSVSAMGPEPLRYQWRKDGVPLLGATNSNLVLPAVQVHHAGDYDVVVQDTFGNTATSGVATLTVLLPPELGPILGPTGLVCSGDAFALSVRATGTSPLSYQWFRGEEALAGATESAFTVDHATVADAGFYFVTAANAYGVATSSVAVVLVASPPSLVQGPVSHTNVVGSQLTLTAEVMGTPPMAYQWLRDGSPIAGATETALGFDFVLPSDAGGYQFAAWNGCGAVTSGVATVTVVTPPVVTQVEGDGSSGCPGGSLTLRATAEGTPPLSYQWHKDSAALAGATSSLYYLAHTTAGDAGGYWVVVGNPYGSATSSVLTVTFLSPPAIVAPPTNRTDPVGGTVTLSVVAVGTEPLAYQWFKDGGVLAGANGASLVMPHVVLGDAGAYAVAVQNSCGAVTSAVATLTVYQPVEITREPAHQMVPAGGTATFQVTAVGDPAPAYQWSFQGTNLTGATARSLVISNVMERDLGTYQVTVWNEFSATTSAPAWLFMSPSIRSAFAGATLTWGKPGALAVSAIGSGPLSYQWYHDGVAEPGGTNTTLEFAVVQLTDGGMYSVVVSSPYGSVTNPPAQVVVNPAGLTIGMFAGLIIEGVPGYRYVVQYSTDMTDTNAWVTATNLTLTQPVELWVDTEVNVYGGKKRYYRLRPGE